MNKGMEPQSWKARLIREKELSDRYGVSRVTLWRWQRSGVLPPKRQIGPNTTGWWDYEIEDWVQSRPTT